MLTRKLIIVFLTLKDYLAATFLSTCHSYECHIFVFSSIIKNHPDNNKHTVVAFADLSEAF